MTQATRYRRRGTALAAIALSVCALVVPSGAQAQTAPEVDCATWGSGCSPAKAVQVVTYNVREGFGGADGMYPNACPQSKTSDPTWIPGDINPMFECTQDSRNTATRVSTLTNTTYVPDVVLLQETTGNAARRFAQYLEWRFNERYDYQAVATPPPDTTTICEYDPTDPTCTDKAAFELSSGREVKAERDTAVVINATTTELLSTSWVTHKQQVSEVTTTEYVRWRYTPVVHLRKLNGPWTFVAAGMHWTGGNRFKDYASAQQARARWATEVAAELDGAYPYTPEMRLAGGDLNAHRCIDGTPTDGVPPTDSATCANGRSGWWEVLQDDNFRDAGHVARTSGGAVDATSPGERIDYIWSRRVFCSSKADDAYSWTANPSTTGADPASPTGYASDHRALRAMFAYETGGC